VNLPPGFCYTAEFLKSRRADSLFDHLCQTIDWQQYRVRLFGREFSQPRLSAWFADSGVSYSYSGIRMEPKPWPVPLAELRDELCQTLDGRFNSVLLNAYRDGSDAMGWHADDEPELGPAPLIASVSLGQARTMRVRRRGGGRSVGIMLQHGSLLTMHGRSQADYQHSVPRSRRPLNTRINLTYRTIRGA
jgi:alkylated DNA repair dioxygenase AlkB